MEDRPVLLHTALDARDCRALAEFYRLLLGLTYREGDEPPADGSPDRAEWLVLLDDDGHRVLAVQQKDDTRAPTWPSEQVPMQLHQDFRVASRKALHEHGDRVVALGGRLLLDRSDDDGEPTLVMADPAGHPFCLVVQ